MLALIEILDRIFQLELEMIYTQPPQKISKDAALERSGQTSGASRQREREREREGEREMRYRVARNSCIQLSVYRFARKVSKSCFQDHAEYPDSYSMMSQTMLAPMMSMMRLALHLEQF